ncbi:MAG: aldehyde ferredoxin oxidoreductase, partial [bacterium]|nr:aldehyde ferredoxin oxidoreductase [bacterium]
MTKGYMGKVLWVNLSKGTFNEEEISQETYKKYLTGTGLGIHLLRREIKQDIDPLGEDNILGFCSGLLTGTGALFTGRWSVMGKSPLTNTYGDSNCGGNFAPALKRSGYDGIFFKGISSKPVYLFIDEKEPVLKSAAKLWGETDAIEAEEILLEEETANGRKPACAVIGPSGEKLSLISGIVNDRGRIAARSGLGAVMGSKKLKAVVINSRRRVLVDQPELVKKLSQKCAKVVGQPALPPKFGKVLARAGHKLRKLPFGVGFVGVGYKFILKQWGTSGMNQMSINWRDAPIKNWKGSHRDFPDKMSESINPDKIIKREKVKYHCHACPLGCGGLCSMEGRFTETHKPEYETILAFGGLNM